jgi:hypothetical protein
VLDEACSGCNTFALKTAAQQHMFTPDPQHKALGTVLLTIETIRVVVTALSSTHHKQAELQGMR